jgi:hypothetical protein
VRLSCAISRDPAEIMANEITPSDLAEMAQRDARGDALWECYRWLCSGIAVRSLRRVAGVRDTVGSDTDLVL